MSSKKKDEVELPPGIKDPYAELEIESNGGAAVDSKAIKKQYRDLARKYHPDKQHGGAEAAAAAEAKFLKVKAAYEFLTANDGAQRKKYDAAREKKRAADEQRKAQINAMSSKRRAMTAKLEEDEARARKRAAGPSAHDPDRPAARRRGDSAASKAETDRLRQEGMNRRETHTRDQSRKDAAFKAAAAAAAATAAATAEDTAAAVAAGQLAQRQVKVKWKRQKHSHSDDSLAAEFKRFGFVEQVEITGDKGNAAILTFETAAAAAAARDAYADSDSMRVTVAGDKRESRVPGAAVPAHAPGRPDAELSSAHDYEDLAAMKLRQAAEREKLLAEMGGGGGGRGGGTSTPSTSAGRVQPPRQGAVTRSRSVTDLHLEEQERRVFGMMLAADAMGRAAVAT